MKRFLRVRKRYVLFLAVVALGYFGYQYWIRRQILSDLPVMPPQEKFVFDSFAERIPETVQANGITYTVIDNQVRWIPQLYFQKAFERIEEHARSLLRANDETRSLQLTGFYNTLADISDIGHAPTMEKVLNEWCEERGESHIPWLVRGAFKIRWAWTIRGAGYANTVDKNAWEGFHEKLTGAALDLERSYRLNPNDPNSSASLVWCAVGLGLPQEKVVEYYRNALAAEPWNYYAHWAMLMNLKPKWHGSIDQMMDFARKVSAERDAYPSLGFILVNALEELQSIGDEKSVMPVEERWQTTRAVYKGFFEKYPENLPWRFNNASTCLKFRKYDDAKRQFDEIGDRWFPGSLFDSPEEYNQKRASAYFRVGEDLIWKKRMYEPAVGILETANGFHRTADSSFALGVAYKYAGLNFSKLLYLKKAESELKKSLALDPGHKRAKEELIGLAKYRRWYSF